MFFKQKLKDFLKDDLPFVNTHMCQKERDKIIFAYGYFAAEIKNCKTCKFVTNCSKEKYKDCIEYSCRISQALDYINNSDKG